MSFSYFAEKIVAGFDFEHFAKAERERVLKDAQDKYSALVSQLCLQTELPSSVAEELQSGMYRNIKEKGKQRNIALDAVANGEL